MHAELTILTNVTACGCILFDITHSHSRHWKVYHYDYSWMKTMHTSTNEVLTKSIIIFYYFYNRVILNNCSSSVCSRSVPGLGEGLPLYVVSTSDCQTGSSKYLFTFSPPSRWPSSRLFPFVSSCQHMMSIGYLVFY